MAETYLKKPTFAVIAALIVAVLIFAMAGVSVYARATDEYEGELILEAVVSSTADEVEPGTGVFASVAAGDTITVTYKLVKNDGLVEAIFTPTYDKTSFEIASFAVDTDHWSMMDDYSVVDPQTGDLLPMTAMEYVAYRNTRYAADPSDDLRLSFIVSFADVRDPSGTLSDTFLTVVYRATKALAAGADFTFGFDVESADGAYTNAAKSGDKLLTLLLKTGEEQGEPVTEPLGADTVSLAVWQQTSFEYRFRAIDNVQLLATGTTYALAYDDENGVFSVATEIDPVSGGPVPAESAAASAFTVGGAIPTASNVRGFRVKRWFSVIPQQQGDPIVTEVTAFDEATSIETDEGAYYLAEMAFDLGAGDVNGDGAVTTADILAMKKYLVGTEFEVIDTAAAAWAIVPSAEEATDLFYLPCYDSNGDHSEDTRDLVAIREGLATGYGYVIVTDATVDGVYRSGAQVARADATIVDGNLED